MSDFMQTIYALIGCNGNIQDLLNDLAKEKISAREIKFYLIHYPKEKKTFVKNFFEDFAKALNLKCLKLNWRKHQGVADRKYLVHCIPLKDFKDIERQGREFL